MRMSDGAGGGTGEQRVLVVGGAGYVGSPACIDLSANGFVPVVYDNLSNGHESFVRWGPLEVGDLEDEQRLDAVIAAHRPVAIIHFAALIEVGDSVRDPLSFYRNNVAGTLKLLAAAERGGIDKIVFSSTCATYGDPERLPLDETHRQAPINPYGRTKLMVEDVLRDLDRLRGMRHVALRYFNAAGADPEGRIGESHEPETHAVPLAIAAALGRRDAFRVFGTDYDTRDGTCVRDFVHVMDLADAHTRALRYLIEGGRSVSINLGTGTGTTVRELVHAIGEASGRTMPLIEDERRPGDAPVLVADNARAQEVLGWTPRHDLDSIIRTAFAWHAKQNAGAA